MARPINPYIAGNPVGGLPAFVGREDVLRAVLSVLRDPQHDGIVLYGQRRIGKTSILLQLAGWLRQNGGPQTVYFDLQDNASSPVGKIMVDLASTIARALGLPVPSPGPDAEAWFRDTWLPQVLGAFSPDEPLAILLDEFDVLASAEAQRAASTAFFMYLRKLLATTAHRLRFVIVIGRNIEDLSTLAGPLFKTMPSKRVSLLLQDEAAGVVRLSEERGSLSWTPAAIERTWALTHGHPYLLQHLCWEVWERAHQGAGPPGSVDASDIEAAVQASIDASLNMLEWLWSGLQPATRVVASALAAAGPGTITEDTLHDVLRVSGVRVVMRELRDAPRLLQEWDVIEPSGPGYVFRVELLRRWIAHYKPLQRVQKELDYIEPAAESFYRTGETLYHEGHPDDALIQLRQAMARNPNHLRASDLLAEILISKNAWDEARRVLEKLHENYPVVARPRLVDVLLTQASEARDEKAKVALYDRVLALEPHNTVAEERMRALRKEGGEKGTSATDPVTAPKRNHLALLGVGALGMAVLLGAFPRLLNRGEGGGGSSSGSVAGPASSFAQPEVVLRLHGSNTIGAALGPALAEAFLLKMTHAVAARRIPVGVEEVRVEATPSFGGLQAIEIVARGSNLAFTDLKAGTTDIGMASRPIKDVEVSDLSSLGDMRSPACEHVLALDGIAVIVSPENGIQQLSKAQLAGIFSGKIDAWSEVGGTGGAIKLYARDDKSGTFDTFENLVLKPADRSLSPAALRFESSNDISQAVARDPSGIGFVALPAIYSAKPVMIQEPGTIPLLPTKMTVSTEDYPLTRRLFLYTSAFPASPWTREFVDFALSDEGQEIVDRLGFVGMRVAEQQSLPAPPCPSCSADYQKTVAGAERLRLNFRFQSGSLVPDNRAKRDLGRVGTLLGFGGRYQGRTVMLLGFSDNQGDRAANSSVSLQRARTISDLLKARGIEVSVVKGFGPENPIADNSTEVGRQKNRRVEVWVK